MKEKIIEWLKILKKEVDKRNVIYEYGVDLINYENAYSQAAIEMIVYSLFLMNKTTEKSEAQIKDEVGWWLYEDVEKKYWVKKKEYNVEKAEDFVKFILKV